MNCPSCGTAGSNNFIVCSYLDHFIEECFPDEYKSRTLKIQTSSGLSFRYFTLCIKYSLQLFFFFVYVLWQAYSIFSD